MIPEVIEKLNNDLKEEAHKLLDLYYCLKLSSIITEGDIKIAIKKKENDIKFIEAQINDYNREIGELPIFKVIVITGTTHRVKKHLGDELFNLLNPSVHDDDDCGYWMPFNNEAKEASRIRDILSILKFKGYNLLDYYVEGSAYEESIIKLTQSPKTNIAIIDLLSLDDENQKIVGYFNKQEVVGLLIPINTKLHIKVIEFINSLRARVFNQFESNVYDIFYSATTDMQVLLIKLERLMKINYPTINSIDTPDGDSRLRKLGTGFN